MIRLNSALERLRSFPRPYPPTANKAKSQTTGPRLVKNSTGPGTELKNLLRNFGITPTEGCGCNGHAAVMNAEGPDWCWEHLEEIIDWMEKEAKKRGLPFVRLASRILVKRAIHNARKKERFLK
jgi:hypothetical protein